MGGGFYVNDTHSPSDKLIFKYPFNLAEISLFLLYTISWIAAVINVKININASENKLGIISEGAKANIWKIYILENITDNPIDITDVDSNLQSLFTPSKRLLSSPEE